MIKSNIKVWVMGMAICSFSYVQCMEHKQEGQFGLSFICTLSNLWSHFGKNDPDSNLGTTWNEGVNATGRYLDDLFGITPDDNADSKTESEPKSSKEKASSSQQK